MTLALLYVRLSLKSYRLELNEWLRPIQENYKTLEQNFLRLEPEKNTVSKGKKDKVEAIRMNWLGRLDSNQRSRDQNPMPCRLATPQQKEPPL